MGFVEFNRSVWRKWVSDPWRWRVVREAAFLLSTPTRRRREQRMYKVVVTERCETT